MRNNMGPGNIAYSALACKMKRSAHRGMEDSALKTQINTVDYKNHTADFVNHTADYKNHSADLSFQRTVFHSSMHRQYVFRALFVHIEYGVLSSAQANVPLQTAMPEAAVCLVRCPRLLFSLREPTLAKPEQSTLCRP